MHKIASLISLAVIWQGATLIKAEDSAFVIGGFGASDSVQVVTANDVCLGQDAAPTIPKAPDGRVGMKLHFRLIAEKFRKRRSKEIEIIYSNPKANC